MNQEIKVGQVAMIPLASIVLGTRIREEMGDLGSIEKSMKEVGLISPLAVKPLDNEKFFLLAGGRRYLILEKNKVETVSVRIFPADISELEVKIIEMSENFYRKDLEYYEYDSLLREITELKQRIYGSKPPGPGGEGWTLEDTADMAGITNASVSTAIKRSEAREAYPELFDNCKTQRDATKIIEKMNEMVIKDQIARKLEAGRSNSRINQLANLYILKDFFEGVKEIPAGVFHLVEVDPPYAIGLTTQKKKDGESQYTLSEYNEIPADEYLAFLQKLFKECYRVMATHSWLLCWFAPEPWFNDFYRELRAAGFETTRMCGIWTKGGSGQSMNPTIRLANSYEMFFYAWKGQPALNKAGHGNDFHYSPIPAQQKTHPTEKPIDMMREMYETFAFPGSRVLIPFLGSGNGLIAAQQAGMTGTGFEISKSYRDSFLVKVHGMK